METIVRSSMVIIDNNLISPETYDQICETGDLEAGILNEFKDMDEALCYSFTPEVIYCKTGASLDDVALTEEEKGGMLKLLNGEEEVPIPGTQIVVIPLEIDKFPETETVRKHGMTPIEDIKALATSGNVYEQILEDYTRQMDETDACFDALNYGTYAYFRINSYKNTDYRNYHAVEDMKGKEVDTDKFLFVFFVTPFVIPDCTRLVDENGDYANLERFRYGLYYVGCYYENVFAAWSPDSDDSPESMDMVVDYDEEADSVVTIL